MVAVDTAEPPRPYPGGDRVDFRQGAAGDIAHLMKRRREHVDIVVLDPPRTGAIELMQALAAMRPGRIVYVSCDPATLARDAGRLVEAGYRPSVAYPIDLMPQTSHVEVVLTLALPS